VPPAPPVPIPPGAFRALATAFVPEIAQATPAQWAATEQTIADFLARRGPALRRQLGLLGRALALVSRVRYGRSLAALPPDRLTALLTGLAHAPVLPVRRGIWGLRTLVLLGWYTQDQVAAAIGYRASPLGWGARR
jgi:hypothetical protein